MARELGERLPRKEAIKESFDLGFCLLLAEVEEGTQISGVWEECEPSQKTYK